MPRQKREEMTVKIDADLVRMARIIAAATDAQLSHTVSDLLRPVITEKYRQLDLSAPLSPKIPKPRK